MRCLMRLSQSAALYVSCNTACKDVSQSPRVSSNTSAWELEWPALQQVLMAAELPLSMFHYSSIYIFNRQVHTVSFNYMQAYEHEVKSDETSLWSQNVCSIHVTQHV